MSEPIVIDFAAFPVAERDEALGAYMNSWNAVERALFVMTVTLTRADFAVARAIYANANSVSALRELLLALGALWLTPGERRELERGLDKVKTYATKRNRIVHGEWIPHLDNPAAPRRFEHWTRHYHSPDHETFMGALTGYASGEGRLATAG
jgi:hypothetical protein